MTACSHNAHMECLALMHIAHCVEGVMPVDEPTTVLGQSDSDGEPALGPMICGKRGTTYQPSRRKRINSHGLEKR